MKFNKEIEDFLKHRSLANVATSDKTGKPNLSLKGIIDFDCENGILFFFDLYCKQTRKNLQENPQIAVTLVDYENFAGFQFKGKAEIIDSGQELEKYVFNWHLIKHNQFKERLSWHFSKILKNKPSEFDLPKPKYLVKIKVEEILDLAQYIKHANE
ncbi:pyridoxamine 5'-phosphate oxidase family protein [Candidatus Margulisiibacteriota bacterium]